MLELHVVPLPPVLVGIWDVFVALNNARGGSGFGPGPIALTEIDAWQRLNRCRLLPWEIECVQACDAAWLEDYAAQQKANQQ